MRRCFVLKHFGCLSGAQMLCFKACRVPSDVFGCFRVWPSGALLTASEAFRVRSTVWDLKLLNGTRWGDPPRGRAVAPTPRKHCTGCPWAKRGSAQAPRCSSMPWALERNIYPRARSGNSRECVETIFPTLHRTGEEKKFDIFFRVR